MRYLSSDLIMLLVIRNQQTRDIEPLLVQCWASVVDGGPTLNQQWLNLSSSLGDVKKQEK